MIRQYYGIPNDAKYGEEFMSRFPILFQHRNKSMQETCMCWGIECPKGWYHILEQLCTILEFRNMEFTKNYGVAVVADQVKEKFGTLRFYYTVRNVDKDGKCLELTSNDQIPKDWEAKLDIATDYLEMLTDQIIEEAERLTENTCADCGDPLNDENRVETKGWITYICKECDEKRRAEIEEDFQKMKEEAAEYRKEPKEDEEEESSGDEFPPPWDEEADKAFLDEHAEKTNILIGKADEILEEKFPPHSRMMD